MNKLIIVEGIDRVGKNMLINGIIPYLGTINFCYRHFGKPPATNPFGMPYIASSGLSYQMTAFKHEFDIAKMLLDRGNNFYNENTIIWNRSHLGEYVYGPLYRKEEPSLIKNYIHLLEGSMTNLIKNVYLILLKGDPTVIANNDDGKSLGDVSSPSKLANEIRLFDEIFEASIIPNKLTIDVTDNGSFKDQKTIIDNAKAFLF